MRNESRLGARTCFPSDYLTEDGFVDGIKKRTRWKIGEELVGYIAEQTTPVVVRIYEQLDNFDLFMSEFKIIVDLNNVEMMHVRMLELPPFEFVSRTADERVVIEWQCGYCGQVNLIEKHLECRKCGAPRKAVR